MADNDTYTATLAELDSIANSAMTEGQRELRAAPVLDKASVHVNGLCTALALEDLDWNRAKAVAAGVSLAQWQEALDVAGLEECGSLGELLGVIHRAESAAAMLRAGYRAVRGADGAVSWRR
jgi:hypothetical protein